MSWEARNKRIYIKKEPKHIKISIKAWSILINVFLLLSTQL